MNRFFVVQDEYVRGGHFTNIGDLSVEVGGLLNGLAIDQIVNDFSFIDSDNDGIPDFEDPDMDNDGFDNDIDIFPLDPAEHSDLDDDGIGDNSDPDRDGEVPQ